MSTRKKAGLDARASAVAAAAQVSAEETSPEDQPEEEGVNLTLRLPIPVLTALQQMSVTLKAKRLSTPGRKLKKVGASDPLSVNGLIRTAVKEWLERQ